MVNQDYMKKPSPLETKLFPETCMNKTDNKTIRKIILTALKEQSEDMNTEMDYNERQERRRNRIKKYGDILDELGYAGTLQLRGIL